jgi:hypothetical protein
VRGGVTNCFKCEDFPTGPCYTYTGEGASRIYTPVTNSACVGASTEIVSGKYREAIRILPEPLSVAACKLGNTGPNGDVCGYMLGCSASGICSGS